MASAAVPVSAPMVLDFEVCQEGDCTSFDVTDTTGVYSSSNSGGYGNPNFDTTDAIGAYVDVTLPDLSQVLGISVYPTLPDSTGLVPYTITNSDLSLTGSLPDGLYVITYYVNFNNANSQTVQHTVTKSFLLTCTIKCCVDTMISKIASSSCSCEDVIVKNALLAFSLYQALLHAGGCGNYTAITALLDRLDRLCSITDCGCS